MAYYFLDNNKKADSIQHQSGAGFTLIELVITIGVFTIGIMAAFTLALANSNTTKENSDRVLAANLAREGLELTRNIRDSNYLRRDANDISCGGLCDWNSGILQSDFFIVDYDVYAEGQTQCGGMGNMNSCITSCRGSSCDLNIDANGFYSHSSIGSMETSFSRVVQVDKICLDDSGANPLEYVRDSCLSGEEEIGIEATVRVVWERAGKEHYLDVVDNFYDWRNE